MTEMLLKGFRLGEVEVKPAECVVIVNGAARRVEPKAMEVLVALASGAGDVVSRQDLMTRVWPRGYVTDDTLHRCISNLRSALGDDRQAPRFIATVPRRGYRLACPAEPEAKPQPPNGTLVLPFQNLSPAADEYLADGLTELLIARLSVVLDGPVISRTTAMTLKNAQRDVRSIREQLGVRWVVEGSLMPLQDQVQVVVQLIDAEFDTHAWADTWTRPLSDSLTLLNEISREVAARIRTELQPGNPPAAKSPTLPTDLLRQYLHGLQLVSKRTHAALHQSVTCFERVLERLPDHAPSLSGLALAWVLLTHYNAVPARVGFPRARELAEAALRTSPEPQADALAHCAAVEFFFDWDFDRAQATVESALALNPSHEYGLLVATDVHMVRKRNERAQSYMDRALAVDPLNVGLLMNAGDHLILQQRFGEAVNALAAALEIEPRFRPARLRMALACAYDGRGEDAVHAMTEVRVTGGEDAAYFEYLAIVHGRLGPLRAAHEAASRLQDLADRQASVSPWALARAWASAGDADRAEAHLHAAFEARSSSMPFLGITPILEPIRDRPGVRALMQQVGLND